MTTLDYRSYKVEARGDLDIFGTREFDAPRELVWKAYTTPELLKRWLLGPDGWELAVCEVDLRPGGKYRWEWRKVATGATMGMGGTYVEVAKPGRLVNTEEFDEAWYPGKMVATLEFLEQGGKTLLQQNFRYDSREGRDMVIKSRMDEGMVASYNRLDDVLAEISKQGSK